MNPLDDLAFIIALAKRESQGQPIKYYPGLSLAYARTITYLVEHYEPKAKTVILKHSTTG